MNIKEKLLIDFFYMLNNIQVQQIQLCIKCYFISIIIGVDYCLFKYIFNEFKKGKLTITYTTLDAISSVITTLDFQAKEDPGLSVAVAPQQLFTAYNPISFVTEYTVWRPKEL